MTNHPTPDPLGTDKFRADLEKLLQLYYDHDPSHLIPNGWVLLTASVNPTTAHQGTASYGLYVPTQQPPHVTRGILATSVSRAEAAQQRELFRHWAEQDENEGDEQ